MDFSYQFEISQTGSGSDLMDADTALKFLEYVSNKRHVFQSMEAFKLDNERLIPNFDYAILGLRSDEKTASTHSQYIDIAKYVLNAALKDSNSYVFKIWVENIDSILRKRAFKALYTTPHPTVFRN